jgi:hypothetical protein
MKLDAEGVADVEDAVIHKGDAKFRGARGNEVEKGGCE